ncbi:YeeE/YedE family protein [Corallococcus sp. bb12-1]|uniref:DUF6691 family protein n=1 Tax=Corallococcus sp. bb12-1 TaxID=2996784 RepID=UPI002271268A|nr:DUF6691 family protein [Corallococcus sp. bb12-1]MCY1040774.1 YeeE/YedE family protein [Corallococcus sp. bb12-1]
MRSASGAFFSGLLFALGLGLGGMTNPSRVLAFLDVAGDWDFRLALVMGGAVAVHAALRPLILRRKRPLFAEHFPTFPARRVDGRLLAGAALFGMGWGLGGYCPGPALTSLATGAPSVLLFVAAMFAGMALARGVQAAVPASGRPAGVFPEGEGKTAGHVDANR